MKIRRQHLIIAAIVLLAITFLVIGVLHQQPPIKYYAHSLRNWQEADSVAGYPIATNGSPDVAPTEFRTTEFQPNLSTLSPMELFHLPTARDFENFIEPRAVSTGLVLYTGEPQGYEGQAVLLGHRLLDGSIVQSFYYGLNSVHVTVGKVIPRGTLLGKGEAKLELREGVSIDIAQEEIAGLTLNSQDGPKAPNRINLDEFYKKHGVKNPQPDPLTTVQENQLREARQKIGL